MSARRELGNMEIW